jgi:RHS repeat-associated protein
VDLRRGFLSSITATAAGTTLQSLSVTHFPNGTIQSRTDGLTGVTEDYTYDSMNRLDTWSVSGNHGSYKFDYDVLDNYLGRTAQVAGSPLPNYTNHYDRTNGAGPRGITSSSGGIYKYDGKGNQTDGPGRQVGYTSFDLPRQITSAGKTVGFGYDAFGARVVKNDGTTKTVSILGLYEVRTSSAGASHLFYIRGGGRVVAQMSIATNGAEETLVMLSDQLGSPAALVTTSGVVRERFKFEPFGSRVDPVTYAAVSAGSAATSQTFAEHLSDAEVGLINMTARLYDPAVGRFLTADRLLKLRPSNAYTYARNNPTSVVDPSGLQDEPDGPDDDGIPTIGISASAEPPPPVELEIEAHAEAPLPEGWDAPVPLNALADLPAMNMATPPPTPRAPPQNGVVNIHFLTDGKIKAGELKESMDNLTKALGAAHITVHFDTDPRILGGQYGQPSHDLSILFAKDKASGLDLLKQANREVFASAMRGAQVWEPGKDVDALGQAFGSENFAVINADKVTRETAFTSTATVVISNIVMHEVGHMITPQGEKFDHSLGGVMAPGVSTKDGAKAWTQYPREVLREAVNRFCGGGSCQ